MSLSPLASRSLRLRLRSRSARSARSCLRRVMSEKSEGEDMKRATRVKFLPARLTRLRGEQTIRLRLMVKGLGNNPLDTAGIRSQVQTAHVLVTPSPSSIHYEPPKGENGENEGRPWDRVSPRLVVSSLLRFSVRHVPHVLHPRYARLRDERGTARDERRPNRVSGEDRRVTEDPARSEVTRRVTKGAN